MHKKLITLLSLTLSVILGASFALPTFAEPQTNNPDNINYDDQVMPISNTNDDPETSEPVPTSDDSTDRATVYIECRGNQRHSYCSNEYICINSGDPDLETCAYAATPNEKFPEYYCIEDEYGERTCDKREVFQNIIDEGLSGEGEVVCATPGEPGCEDSAPALWPLVLSLSALGLTILFVILINLFGRYKA